MWTNFLFYYIAYSYLNNYINEDKLMRIKVIYLYIYIYIYIYIYNMNLKII